MAGFFSNIGRAIGWSTPSTSIPQPPPFPTTQYAQSLESGQQYATGLADLLARRRQQQLYAGQRGQERDIGRSLARRGMSQSGTALRLQREIQEASRLGERDIQEERGRMIQEAVARRSMQEADAARWYTGLQHQSNLMQAQERAARRATQSQQRMSGILAALGLAGNIPGMIGGGGEAAAAGPMSPLDPNLAMSPTNYIDMLQIPGAASQATTAANSARTNAMMMGRSPYAYATPYPGWLSRVTGMSKFRR